MDTPSHDHVSEKLIITFQSEGVLGDEAKIKLKNIPSAIGIVNWSN